MSRIKPCHAPFIVKIPFWLMHLRSTNWLWKFNSIRFHPNEHEHHKSHHFQPLRFGRRPRSNVRWAICEVCRSHKASRSAIISLIQVHERPENEQNSITTRRMIANKARKQLSCLLHVILFIAMLSYGRLRQLRIFWCLNCCSIYLFAVRESWGKV